MYEISAALRIILATLSARYIHASLGLRYLLANLDRHGGAGLRAQAVLRASYPKQPAQREPTRMSFWPRIKSGVTAPGIHEFGDMDCGC